MANQALIQASRALTAVSLLVALSACGTNPLNRTPEVIAFEKTTAEDRWGSGNSGSGDIAYTGVVPTAVIPEGELNPNAPSSYTVVRGDTLWDISGQFLNSAWLWPQIWDYNPQIQNPHLIYPGDEISMSYVNGRPSLTLSRNGQMVGSADGTMAAGSTAVRLSPRIRSESLFEAVPTIPADAIRQFLVRPNVVTSTQLQNAPYVVGNIDDRLISSLGQEIFVRGKMDQNQTNYGIYRQTKTLKDPKSGKTLGYEVLQVAEAKLLNMGDPSTMIITSSSRETISGDVLLPSANDGAVHTYTPRMPSLNGEGQVVSLVDAISQSGRDQIIVTNLGSNAGIQVGDVLAIESRGQTLIDRHGRRSFDRVDMPFDRIGVVMIFQTFDEVSYGLVMESTDTVKYNDALTGI
jgi:hypothetical protein